MQHLRFTILAKEKRSVAYRLFRFCVLAFLPLALVATSLGQQTTGSLHGVVADPTGAIIPGASVVVSGNGKNLSTTSSGDGHYSFSGLQPGQYTVNTSIEGFTPYQMQGVAIAAGANKTLNISMTIATQQQQVQVNAESSSISTAPSSNVSAVIIKGKDLDALSDDPDQLATDLQALAGPSAGPNGGQIYVDGFSGGEIPPKADIREIIINQDPFSAEFDSLGYGRIEIYTKAGTGQIHGHIFSMGNDSPWDAQNPILNSNPRPAGSPPIVEPPYYSYFFHGDVGGPMTKNSSFFSSIFNRSQHDQQVIDAIDPGSITTANPNGTALNSTISNPSSRLDVGQRFDYQLGQSNSLTGRYEYYRSSFTNGSVGELALPEQATDGKNQENTLFAIDSLVLSKNFVDNIRFRYRRIRNSQTSQYTMPRVSVSGAFTDGGNRSGTTRDNQDDYEVQNYITGAVGNHALNFGGRFRAYRDANFSNAGTNGSYTFTDLPSYLAKTPRQYTVTVVNNGAYTARAIPMDLALFYQDDFTVNSKLTLSYGLRWETQNEIHDKSDFAPRFYVAYALGHGTKPKTVVRAGYGWFYQRFTIPNGTYGAPYILSTIRHNLPTTPGGLSNQQIYTITNPTGYAETSPGNPIKPPNPTSSTSAPTYNTIAPNFHAALDMQAAIGVDRAIAKGITGNVTYLYSRGVHDFLSNNITAPFFDGFTNTYPTTPLTAPATNIYQFQSGGVYRESQVMTTLHAQMKKLTIFSYYAYTNAKGDSSGVSHFASNASDPGQDYGPTKFSVRNRFLILGNVDLPYAISFAPFFVYNSGIPYNIMIGNDLTANNQFNARPAFAPASDCSSGTTPARYYSTPYGCLDANPVGTNEKIIPYGVGTGPSNYSLNVRLSKVIGFGPKLKTGGGGGGGYHGHGHGLGGRGLSGNQGGPGRLDASVPRKYNLTLGLFAANIFNRENLAPPNATLTSPFFGKSQALAGGFFGPRTSGNRSIFLTAQFNF